MPFDTKWFKVRQDRVQLPDGKVIEDYYLWESEDVAMVVPITSEGKLVLVQQYKHGAGDIMIECPAGYLAENEDGESAARRELGEETGYEIKEMEPLGALINYPTKETGKLHVFAARVSKSGEQNNLDPTENIQVLELPVDEVLQMISDGRIWATGTIAATFMALKKWGMLENS